eukprot:scaffold11919_cov96-Isochrysis_galbana.AAC.2
MTHVLQSRCTLNHAGRLTLCTFLWGNGIDPDHIRDARCTGPAHQARPREGCGRHPRLAEVRLVRQQVVLLFDAVPDQAETQWRGGRVAE